MTLSAWKKGSDFILGNDSPDQNKTEAIKIIIVVIGLIIMRFFNLGDETLFVSSPMLKI